MVAALDRQRQRLVPLRRVVGTTTRERERERERERGERGREREEEGRGGEREKGEREKRGREIEGALFFFHISPVLFPLHSDVFFILVTRKSLFFLLFLLSPFYLLLSPPTRQMCLFLPSVEISSIMATIPSSSELLSARFRGMGGRETAAVLNSSVPNE
jgi:hypothetical protein